MTREKTKPQFTKKEVVIRFAASGMEIAAYIIAPILIGFAIGRQYGPIGSLIGLFTGAVLGLYIAVKRAIKMTV
jgi:F0F1-type ATP synthase assembly protein I